MDTDTEVQPHTHQIGTETGLLWGNFSWRLLDVLNRPSSSRLHSTTWWLLARKVSTVVSSVPQLAFLRRRVQLLVRSQIKRRKGGQSEWCQRSEWMCGILNAVNTY